MMGTVIERARLLGNPGVPKFFGTSILAYASRVFPGVRRTSSGEPRCQRAFAFMCATVPGTKARRSAA